jgi:hypothetical protein
MSDLADVGLHPALDDDGLPVTQLALELEADLEDHGTDAPAHDLVQAVAVARDQVPARLLEQVQVARVVDVTQRVQVLLPDLDRVLVHGSQHSPLPAAA